MACYQRQRRRRNKTHNWYSELNSYKRMTEFEFDIVYAFTVCTNFCIIALVNVVYIMQCDLFGNY